MSQSIIGQVIAWLNASYQRRKAIDQLSGLDDRLLRDIGIDSNQIREVVEGRILPVDPPAAKPAARPPGFVLHPGTSRGFLR